MMRLKWCDKSWVGSFNESFSTFWFWSVNWSMLIRENIHFLHTSSTHTHELAINQYHRFVCGLYVYVSGKLTMFKIAPLSHTHTQPLKLCEHFWVLWKIDVDNAKHKNRMDRQAVDKNMNILMFIFSYKTWHSCAYSIICIAHWRPNIFIYNGKPQH